MNPPHAARPGAGDGRLQETGADALAASGWNQADTEHADMRTGFTVNRQDVAPADHIIGNSDVLAETPGNDIAIEGETFILRWRLEQR